MISAFKKFWTNFANFKGRTRRKDYWLAVLALAICSFVIGIVANIGGTQVFDETLNTYVVQRSAIGNAIYYIWGLATLIPALSLEFRRLHDTGKSGWFLLWNLLPIIGEIIYFIAMVKKGDAGENKYGADPKQAAIEA